jgi:uncharacterized protein (DUF433 family)
MEPAIIDRGSGPEIAGTRISVYEVYHYLVGGSHPAQIAVWLGLSSAQVQAAVQYIDAHRVEVEAAHQRIEERIARGNAPVVREKLEAAHRKRSERQTEVSQQEANRVGDPAGR